MRMPSGPDCQTSWSGMSDPVVRVGSMTVIDGGGLDEQNAAGHIHGICLKTGPPQRVGVELEWLVRDARDPALPVPAGRIAAAVSAFDAARGNPGHGRQNGEKHARPELPTSSRPGVLPSGALLTTEPGGQLELSSQPADSLGGLVRATSADLVVLRAELATRGLELAGIGLDPLRPPRRVLTLPRYAAMEAFFDAGGPWGRQMMCTTASVQVCLDAGDDSDGPSGYRQRWRLLHAIGPVLVGAFANSPLREGKPTGWVSSRQQVWARMDPGRTRPPRMNGDPRATWAAYALDAQVMCVPDPDSADWSAPPGLTFRDWVRGAPAATARMATAHAAAGTAAAGTAARANGEAGGGNGRLRRPTADDLEYHLSTLFPPVRPRGHFELRMIDAQPGDGWIVPLAVSSALLSDAQAGDAALAAVAPLWDGRWPGDDGPWVRAARLGPADPLISRASRECFAVAREALDRMTAPAAITGAVDAFTDQYVAKGRCPADDLLEETGWHPPLPEQRRFQSYPSR
jgi:ergothioneine biosynthesis glutamate--cysteine ligase EgtA